MQTTPTSQLIDKVTKSEIVTCCQQGKKEDAKIYATIRRFEGITDTRETGRLVKEGFVPLIRQIPGFVSYYWVDAGTGVVISTSVFKDKTGAEILNRRAAEWAQQNLRHLYKKQEPQITAGEVIVFESL